MKSKPELRNLYFSIHKGDSNLTAPTYETWLEEQLLIKYKEVDKLQNNQRLETATQILNGMLSNSRITEADQIGIVDCTFDLADRMIEYNKLAEQANPDNYITIPDKDDPLKTNT